jgi:hypothetical protein
MIHTSALKRSQSLDDLEKAYGVSFDMISVPEGSLGRFYKSCRKVCAVCEIVLPFLRDGNPAPKFCSWKCRVMWLNKYC